MNIAEKRRKELEEYQAFEETATVTKVDTKFFFDRNANRRLVEVFRRAFPNEIVEASEFYHYLVTEKMYQHSMWLAEALSNNNDKYQSTYDMKCCIEKIGSPNMVELLFASLKPKE